MKVFISHIDSPLGHNLSRILSTTVVGSHKEEEPAEEGEEQQQQEDQPPAEERNKLEEKPVKETYTIIGSLIPQHVSEPESQTLQPTVPGVMIESGDKKKDQARREAIEKIPVVGQKPKWVQEAKLYTDKESLQQSLLESDVIIYDVINGLDEVTWVVDYLSDNADRFEKPKTFIAISSILTWAKTKSESDDPDAFLAEDEYRRRKPHPNFKDHINVEKNVIKLSKKSNLKAYVIASGLVYHAGDSIFHSLFKAAWHNQDLICYGEGLNYVPMIHLDDLVSITVDVVESTPETKYLLATISDSLGTGAVKKVAKEEAFLDRNIRQVDYDMLTVNLKLDPGHIKEMSVEWKYESGLVENIQQLIQEYKDSRGLWPIKIMVHGPPASGKTWFAQKLADHYKIHLVDADQVVQDTINRLERRVNGERDANAEEGDDDIEVDKELLNELKEAVKANNGKYPPSHVINFVRDRLHSMPCKNQGYILDGFPTNMDEAKDLFKPNDDDGKEDKNPNIDELTAPEYIFSLEATDAFIKQRIMKLPESAVAGTRNSEEALTKRLEEFRKSNTDENTVLNFFDELEIHPTAIAVETREAQDILDNLMYKAIGKPRNYGPSPEQIAEERKRAESIKLKVEAAAAEEREKQEQEELERHKKAVAEWNSRLEEVRKQEKEILEAQSIPLRNYLMKHVMPTLTAGLIELSKARPDDPVDFLAEFMFRTNPNNKSSV